MLEKMLQPRVVQPETKGWFTSWDGRRKNEGFISVSKENSTKKVRKTKLEQIWGTEKRRIESGQQFLENQS